MTLHEIATIWSDGTRFTADDLVRAYRAYEAECEEEGIDADGPETFFKRDMEIIAAVSDDAVQVTRYSQDGTTFVCVGDAETDAADARTAAEGALLRGERLADDMERVEGCCTWTVITGDA